MRYTLLRNAAALLEYGGHRILIDPALDPAGARPPVANTANQRPNPLVELPDGWQEVIAELDALLVTHLHSDHFDATSQRLFAGDILTLAQPEDVDTLGQRGFANVKTVDHSLRWDSIEFTRTPASHGSGRIAEMLAPVSGFVLKSRDEPTLYIAGDTIWYQAVEQVISEHSPDVIVLNASGASFLEGGKIVMDADDVIRVRRAAPLATIILVHLEAINHCHETRGFYRERLPELGLDLANILIPEDGEPILL